MTAASLELGVYICAWRGAIGWPLGVWAHAVDDWIAVGSNQGNRSRALSQPPTRTNKQTSTDPPKLPYLEGFWRLPSRGRVKPEFGKFVACLR